VIRNPILPGFNPDPSICRVGNDYFIATSTFEWYPGVQIHHSVDLVNWELIAHPLNRSVQLDLRGHPDSCGVWAPCLSFANGLFWLVYTDVRRYDGNFKDAHNLVVTSSDVCGNWSDPTYLNSSGFDPSLFHDEDGRKWLLNLNWNHRASGLGETPRHSPFGGIVLQEYCDKAKGLIGEPEIIFHGSELGLSEGPHVFVRDGWYYLVVAEGGTGYEHAVTHARSRSLNGPYELHPDTHVIRTLDSPFAPLQRAGHGQTVTTPDGQWYHTHLCSRPLKGTQRSPLGRETAIQKCVWSDDGWLRLEHGDAQPVLDVAAPEPVDSLNTSARVSAGASSATSTIISTGTSAAKGKSSELTPAQLAGSPYNSIHSPVDDLPRQYEFNQSGLPIDFQWLRTPDWQRLFSLDARPGFLRLYARESIGSFYDQALLARRQQHASFSAQTSLEFDPLSFQQSAGLVLYYNRHKFHYLEVSHDEEQGRVLNILCCLGDWPESRLNMPLAAPIKIAESGAVSLRCDISEAALQFSWRMGDLDTQSSSSLADDEGGQNASLAQANDWNQIGPTLDASIVSDEAGRGEHANFTGAFVGMVAFDTSGRGKEADFSRFDYLPI